VQTGPAFNTAEPKEEYTSIDEVNRQLAEAREEPDYTEGSLVVEDTPIDENYKPFKGTGVSPTGLVSTPYIQPQVEDEPEPDEAEPPRSIFSANCSELDTKLSKILSVLSKSSLSAILILYLLALLSQFCLSLKERERTSLIPQPGNARISTS
jgi:hypothetical protein